MRVSNTKYKCISCKFIFQERVTPKTSISFFRAGRQRVLGSVCPTCANEIEGFVTEDKEDMDVKVYMDILARVTT